MANKKNDITLEICMGLPGSGKTTWAKSRERMGVRVYDIDQMIELKYYEKDRKEKSRRALFDGIMHNMRYSLDRSVRTVIMDGLFLTNQDVYDIVATICDNFNNIKLIIHYWKEDREACVKNDGGRREVNSVTTILHAPYEYPNKEWLDEKLSELGIQVDKIVEHEVVLKPDWIRYFRGKMYLNEDGKLKGQRWTTGGAYGSCWHDGLTPVSAESPRNFDELDELLSEICPNITFLHYKKLQQQCVTLDSYHEHDYYGGGINYSFWVCDLEKMYSLLDELGYEVTPE